jgi:hypothetical protein
LRNIDLVASSVDFEPGGSFAAVVVGSFADVVVGSFEPDSFAWVRWFGPGSFAGVFDRAGSIVGDDSQYCSSLLEWKQQMLVGSDLAGTFAAHYFPK